MKKLYSIFFIFFLLIHSNCFTAQTVSFKEEIVLPFEIEDPHFKEKEKDAKIKKSLSLMQKGKKDIVTKSDIKKAYTQLMTNSDLITNEKELKKIEEAYYFLREVFDLKKINDSSKEQLPTEYQIHFEKINKYLCILGFQDQEKVTSKMVDDRIDSIREYYEESQEDEESQKLLEFYEDAYNGLAYLYLTNKMPKEFIVKREDDES